MTDLVAHYFLSLVWCPGGYMGIWNDRLEDAEHLAAMPYDLDSISDQCPYQEFGEVACDFIDYMRTG